MRPIYQPRLLCIDERSLGLAPRVRTDAFRAIQEVHAAGIPLLQVEQEVAKVFQIATRNYALSQGHFIAQGTDAELSADENLRATCLGL